MRSIIDRPSRMFRGSSVGKMVSVPKLLISGTGPTSEEIGGMRSRM
jgi:hypothetical protein